MKEKPILFSGEMVRAILDGRKTQTRRVCKPEHFNGSEMPLDHTMENAIQYGAKCPYGKVGDRLWVKETFAPNGVGSALAELFQSKQQPKIYYRATHEGAVSWNWKPSIFMRREYSRITLEIVSVRVERLNDISQSDAVAEGVAWSYDEQRSPCEAYQSLWESINGAGSWAVNPWVWVIEFKRVNP